MDNCVAYIASKIETTLKTMLAREIARTVLLVFVISFSAVDNENVPIQGEIAGFTVFHRGRDFRQTVFLNIGKSLVGLDIDEVDLRSVELPGGDRCLHLLARTAGTGDEYCDFIFCHIYGWGRKWLGETAVLRLAFAFCLPLLLLEILGDAVPHFIYQLFSGYSLLYPTGVACLFQLILLG